MVVRIYSSAILFTVIYYAGLCACKALHIVEGGGIESVDESIIEAIVETTMFNHLSVIFVGIGWV